MSSHESEFALRHGESQKPDSKFYIFEQLVSEGPITQSWVALNSKTKERCFIKASITPAGLDESIVRSIILRSYELQKLIRSHDIIRANRKVVENGRLFIEYSYLQSEEWQPLTPELFGRYFSTIFPLICKILDYLHILGLVHCDLKLDNFLINKSQVVPKILLSDLDFLTKSNSHPESRIFGSHDYIAPEIMENDIVLVQSDNFSLGRVLKEFLHYLQSKPIDTDAHPGMNLDSILYLTEELTIIDPNGRPKFLLEALFRHGIITDSDYRVMEKSLFGMKLLSDFGIKRHEMLKNESGLQHFLSWQNHVFGFPGELSEALEVLYRSRPLQALELFGSLIKNANLNRYDTYWQVAIEDKELIRAFATAEGVVAHKEFRFFCQLPAARSTLNAFCEDLLTRSKDSNQLKAFLALKRMLNFSNQDHCTPDEVILNKILLRLGEIAQILGRYEEANKYLSDVLGNQQVSVMDQFRIIFDISYNFLLSGKLEECYQWLQRGEALSEKMGDNNERLIFLRQGAWVFILRGQYDAASERLAGLMVEAEQSGHIDELGKLHIVLGILHWRKGEFAEAEKALLDSLSELEKAGNGIDLISPLSNLSLLYFETAEYRKAADYGERAVEIAEGLSQAPRVPYIYTNLAICYSRLAEYKTAEKWLQTYLTGKSQKYDRIYFRSFCFYQGNLLLKQCHLQQAREKFQQALSMYDSGEKSLELGKLLQSAAIIALFQGESSQFDEFLVKARDVFASNNDNASLVEIEFLANLNILYNSSDNLILPLLTDLDQLIKYNRHYYATLCLFHILLYADGEVKREVLSRNESLYRLIMRSDVPLFQAAYALCRNGATLTGESSQSLFYLKIAYRKLHNSGDHYYAICICQRLAEIHQSVGQLKLAKKFLFQALKLAESLDNKLKIGSIRNKIQAIPDQSFNRSQMFESFKRVSEILKNIDDYDAALKSLVWYAINETGAERGVLLLSSDEQSRLMIRSFVNCDAEHLEDIREFSQSVCKMVSKDMNPLIIDDARIDDRTKKYKSIMAYNILSVVCLPIRIDEGLAGVIYLDHHTIPALFEPDDITFIHSIANFISILLSAIRKQKYQKETKQQLIDDLARLGGVYKFVTQNAIMHQLFSKLPEIARHSVNVLLVGESGTGKEILAQMIHDLSLRSKGPIVKLNCAAIASSLIESELFGVAKNVATGVDEREGKLSAADGGTLLLDEIGDMPLEIQSKVLRVLEDQHFEKVGSNRTIVTDIRFIYATNKDLRAMIKQGKFREDLYYRINTIIIHIPPLRERRDDIPLLLEHFVSTFIPDKTKRPIFSSTAMEAMIEYSWPGNVRELRNLAEKYCLLYSGRQVDLIDLPPEFGEKTNLDYHSKRLSDELEKGKIHRSLVSSDWNQSEVSRILGMPLSTLRRKIKKYQLFKGI